MKSYISYLEEIGATAAPAVASSGNQGSAIDRIVDKWVSTLKAQLLHPGNSENHRNLWDRFKNTVSNAFFSRYNKQNPYYWQNKFGVGLGDQSGVEPQEESIITTQFLLGLDEYRDLRTVCDNLEVQLNEAKGSPNIRIMQVIDNAAQNLKAMLKQFVASGTEPSMGEPAAQQGQPESPGQPAAQQGQPGQPQANPQSQGSPQAQQGKFNYTTPPTQGKKWHELTFDEIERWNKYGGGLERRKTGIRKCLQLIRGQAISYLPWILRLGDPRIEVLQNQTSFIDPEKLDHYNQTNGKALTCRNKSLNTFRKMESKNRIENANNPIKSEDELKQRVMAAQRISAATRDSEQDKIADEEEDAATAQLPTSTPVAPATASAPTAPTGNLPSFKNHTMETEPKAGTPHHTDPTALSRPLHTTADMDEPDKERKLKEKIQKIQTDLTSKVMDGNLPEEAQKELLQTIASIKTGEDVERIQKMIDALTAPGDDNEFEWNMSDYVKYYKEKLQHPIVENKPVLKQMPFNEKIKYLKENFGR